MELRSILGNQVTVLFDVNNNVSVLKFGKVGYVSLTSTNYSYYMVKLTDRVLYRYAENHTPRFSEWVLKPELENESTLSKSLVSSSFVAICAMMTWVGLDSYDKTLTDEFPKNYWSHTNTNETGPADQICLGFLYFKMDLDLVTEYILVTE